VNSLTALSLSSCKTMPILTWYIQFRNNIPHNGKFSNVLHNTWTATWVSQRPYIHGKQPRAGSCDKVVQVAPQRILCRYPDIVGTQATTTSTSLGHLISFGSNSQPLIILWYWRRWRKEGSLTSGTQIKCKWPQLEWALPKNRYYYTNTQHVEHHTAHYKYITFGTKGLKQQ
jgi:hypothetical protein